MKAICFYTVFYYLLCNPILIHFSSINLNISDTSKNSTEISAFVTPFKVQTDKRLKHQNKGLKEGVHFAHFEEKEQRLSLDSTVSSIGNINKGYR